MQLINIKLKLSISIEKELEKLNEIFMEESKFFLKVEGKTSPSPDVCFRGGVLPSNKSKEDFKMLSCYEDNTLIGW